MPQLAQGTRRCLHKTHTAACTGHMLQLAEGTCRRLHKTHTAACTGHMPQLAEGTCRRLHKTHTAACTGHMPPLAEGTCRRLHRAHAAACRRHMPPLAQDTHGSLHRAHTAACTGLMQQLAQDTRRSLHRALAACTIARLAVIVLAIQAPSMHPLSTTPMDTAPQGTRACAATCLLVRVRGRLLHGHLRAPRKIFEQHPHECHHSRQAVQVAGSAVLFGDLQGRRHIRGQAESQCARRSLVCTEHARERRCKRARVCACTCGADIYVVHTLPCFTLELSCATAEWRCHTKGQLKSQKVSCSGWGSLLCSSRRKGFPSGCSISLIPYTVIFSVKSIYSFLFPATCTCV